MLCTLSQTERLYFGAMGPLLQQSMLGQFGAAELQVFDLTTFTKNEAGERSPKSVTMMN